MYQNPNLTDKIEWIIIDDGCNEKELDSFKAKVIHLPTNSGGASKPRNIGLDNAKGKYIAFIDSDDLVSDDYIELVLKYLKTDIVFISWKSKVHDIKNNNQTTSLEFSGVEYMGVKKQEIV